MARPFEGGMVHEKAGVYVPEVTIQPSQFFGCRDNIPKPLTRLAFALLEGALNDLQFKGWVSHRGSRRRAAVEAKLWFLSASRGPASFVWVCQILNVKPHVMRVRLR
jgi:hypothetical protein